MKTCWDDDTEDVKRFSFVQIGCTGLEQIPKENQGGNCLWSYALINVLIIIIIIINSLTHVCLKSCWYNGMWMYWCPVLHTVDQLIMVISWMSAGAWIKCICCRTGLPRGGVCC